MCIRSVPELLSWSVNAKLNGIAAVWFVPAFITGANFDPASTSYMAPSSTFPSVINIGRNFASLISSAEYYGTRSDIIGVANQMYGIDLVNNSISALFNFEM